MGSLGWSAREYYTSSPYEFHAACEGYLIKEEKTAEMLRMTAYTMVIFQEGKKTINQIWPLPGDNDNTPEMKPLSAEERKEILNRYIKKP